MYTQKSNNTSSGNLRLFGNLRVMIISGLLVAMSIVFGKFLAFNITDAIRISFENLPVIMAGIFFGPFIGGAVGLGADVIGSILKGYSINPIVSFGAMCIGIISGFVSMKLFRKNQTLNIAFSVGLAHLIGSILIKSAGLHFLPPKMPFSLLIYRIPTYIGIGLLEFFIIYMLLKNKAFANQLEKVCNNGRL
ncbi:MAG: folate family ECF transporter S component [Ruminococcus sp.]|nr:folate family ECF transporter S component [Ruminococcus sp.]